MDLLNKLLKGIDHNRWLAIGLLISVGMSVYVIGCESTTTSINDQTVKVTRAEVAREISIATVDLDTKFKQLEAEALKLQKAGEYAQDDLDAQDAKRAALFEIVGTTLTQLVTGGINPATLAAGALTTLSVFAGGGLFMDNRRKDKIIVANKESN